MDGEIEQTTSLTDEIEHTTRLNGEIEQTTSLNNVIEHTTSITDVKRHKSSGAKKTGHYAGLILARGGSKGVKLKNIKTLSGHPLLVWCLRAMIDADVFDSVWVSTENDAIANVAREWGAQVHRRSAESANDHASSAMSVCEFLNDQPDVEHVAMVQCTAPCLHPWHLQQMTRIFLNENYDSVFSVTRRHMFRWTPIDRLVGGETIPCNIYPPRRPRRQDWKGELYENGACYIGTKEVFFAGGQQGGRMTYYEMDPKYSIDIDTDIDFAIAEHRVIKYGYFGKLKPKHIKLAVFQADGVLTDGQVHITADGHEFRSYNSGDQIGLVKLREMGVDVRIISDDDSPTISKLAQHWGFPLAYSRPSKVSILDGWRKELDLDWDQIAYIGGDTPDIGCMQMVGVSGAPGNSHYQVATVANFIAQNGGGKGAAREFCEHLKLVIEKAESVLEQKTEY